MSETQDGSKVKTYNQGNDADLCEKTVTDAVEVTAESQTVSEAALCHKKKSKTYRKSTTFVK